MMAIFSWPYTDLFKLSDFIEAYSSTRGIEGSDASPTVYIQTYTYFTDTNERIEVT